MSDLRQSLYFGMNWPNVAWERNTGVGYQHKQDLVAVFANGFSYLRQKVEAIYSDTGTVDFDTLHDLIFDFKIHFPVSGRVEGVNYYDDLVLMLIDRYKAKMMLSAANSPNSSPANDKSEQPVPLLHIVPETRQTLYDALKPFIDEVDRPALSALIVDGIAPDKKIDHKCQQNVLAYFFLQQSEHNKILSTQTGIASWICANFTPATYDTIYDVIRGNKTPVKSKRIPTNP